MELGLIALMGGVQVATLVLTWRLFRWAGRLTERVSVLLESSGKVSEKVNTIGDFIAQPHEAQAASLARDRLRLSIARLQARRQARQQAREAP